jgi:predicted RND superfamily exporter protein
MRDALEKAFGFVTEHNLVVLVLMLVVTAGVAGGMTRLQTESEAGGNVSFDSEVGQKSEYIQANYGSNETEQPTRPASVYVRDEGGNALSKSALLASLRYQQDVMDNESVAASLGDRGVVSVANIVGTRAAGSQDATLDEQVAALEAASESAVEQLVRSTLSEGSEALVLLPSTYEPGTVTAESTRMVFQFAAEDESLHTAATAALHETTQDRETPELFTTGEHASAAANDQYMQNTMELVVPAALLMILLVLGFSYRDLVDVVVGFTGVVLSVLWMFGILGWLQIPAGMTLIIGPVLIVGLSVDYGLHVFMRYREQRGAQRASDTRAGSEATREGRGAEENIRDPMVRSLSSVAVALGLVTLTAMVGFMANSINELATIEQLAYGITLGVFSTFVVSLTLVPALKVTVDSLLERVGLDRRKQPLGKTRLLQPVLASGVTIARRAAPVVVVLALVAGSAGAVAWTDLDRQSFQQSDGEIAEWKQNLPGPLAWDVSEESQQRQYVDEHYRAASEDARRHSTVLFEGDVTDPAALERVQAVHDRAGETDVVYSQGDAVPMTSPLTVMQGVAAEDEEFAETFADADTDGDGVPDRNVEAVYDALYAADADAASQVIERTDGVSGSEATGGSSGSEQSERTDGEYRSMRALVPVDPAATYPDQTDGMRTVAAAGDGGPVTATAVGAGTLNAAELSIIADNILQTLVLALVAVGVLLTVIYRFVAGSATLGTVTAVPIVVVTALVVGGMWLFGVPLTLLTALLLSLVIGLGIDYNIHISDRFAQELERGRTVRGALLEATTGTGGALLGSTLTSAGAFSALLLHPHPQFQSFGTLVVLALVTSFVVAVFVLPSLITVWARFFHAAPADADRATASAVSQDD